MLNTDLTQETNKHVYKFSELSSYFLFRRMEDIAKGRDYDITIPGTNYTLHGYILDTNKESVLWQRTYPDRTREYYIEITLES